MSLNSHGMQRQSPFATACVRLPCSKLFHNVFEVNLYSFFCNEELTRSVSIPVTSSNASHAPYLLPQHTIPIKRYTKHPHYGD
jgi:hypothetical protein